MPTILVDGVEVEVEETAANTAQLEVPPTDNQATQLDAAEVAATQGDAAAGSSTEQTASAEEPPKQVEGEVLAAVGVEGDGEDDDAEEDEEEELDDDEQMSASAEVSAQNLANNAELAFAAIFKAIVGYAATNGLGFVDLADAETRYFAEKITVALAEFTAAQQAAELLAVPAENTDGYDADEGAEPSDTEEEKFVIGNKEADPMSSSVVLTGEVAGSDAIVPKSATEEVQEAAKEEAAPQGLVEEVQEAAKEEAAKEEAAPQGLVEEVQETAKEEAAPKEDTSPQVLNEESQDAAPKSPVVTFSTAGSAAASGDLSAAQLPADEVDPNLVAAAALAAQNQPRRTPSPNKL